MSTILQSTTKSKLLVMAYRPCATGHCLPPLPPPAPLPRAWSLLLQPQQPSFISLAMPSALPPPNLCTCYSLCVKGSPPSILPLASRLSSLNLNVTSSDKLVLDPCPSSSSLCPHYPLFLHPAHFANVNYIFICLLLSPPSDYISSRGAGTISIVFLCLA